MRIGMRIKLVFLTVVVASACAVAEVGPAEAFGTWPIGHDDYLMAWGTQETQALNPGSLTTRNPGWEGKICKFIKYTPARTACTVTNKYQAVEKYQLRWFFWIAAKYSACAVAVHDYGRHGINQFKKRWKVRAARDFNGSDVAFIPLGKTVWFETAFGYPQGIRCDG
jgi:hypothetical protein